MKDKKAVVILKSADLAVFDTHQNKDDVLVTSLLI